MAEREGSKKKQNSDSDPPGTGSADSNAVPRARGVLLTPGERIAARWDGALRARLNREPLEAFLRSHDQLCALSTSQAVTENLVRACMIMVQPALPHRGADWRAMLQPRYFDALGEAVSRVTRALGDLIEEPQLWRVASLVGVARMLSPNLGMDMAAATAASAVAASVSDERVPVFEETLSIHATIAVNSRGVRELDAIRRLVMRGLAGSMENGASNRLSAPCVTRISAAPPSNR